MTDYGAWHIDLNVDRGAADALRASAPFRIDPVWTAHF
jgi:hypothetical protein